MRLLAENIFSDSEGLRMRLTQMHIIPWRHIGVSKMSSDDKLIFAVQENPVLYDLSHKFYYDNIMKDAVWEDISVKLNESGKY